MTCDVEEVEPNDDDSDFDFYRSKYEASEDDIDFGKCVNENAK